MAEKIVVQFEPLPLYEARIDYLRYCLTCDTYTLNNQKPCYKCGKKERLVSLETLAMKTVRRQWLSQIGITLIIYAVLFIVSRSFKAMLLATLFTGICIVLDIIIYRTFKEAFCAKELEKHLLANKTRIKENLEKQVEQAKELVAEGRYLEAYDELCYIAKLMNTKEVRVYKLICLNHFRLRKDLPLEMKELLLEDCNMLLIRYIGEVAKIKKDLIDEKTISYILKYKTQVLTEEKGKEIIVSVLEATLRSKFLLGKYAGELRAYVADLPKERLLRLCKIQDAIKDDTLRQEILEQIKSIVGDNSTFAPYF